jgi:hypothetical protein
MPHHDISVEEFLLALGRATPITDDGDTFEERSAEAAGAPDRHRSARTR